MGKLSYINDKLRTQTLWQLSHCLVYAEWLSQWGRLDCRFLPRDAYAQRGLCRGKMSVCPSVRPSVRLSHAGIVSKRLYISSLFSPSGKKGKGKGAYSSS